MYIIKHCVVLTQTFEANLIRQPRATPIQSTVPESNLRALKNSSSQTLYNPKTHFHYSRLQLCLQLTSPFSLKSSSMSDEEHHFESKADAGASKTYPQQAGTIRKNGYIVIKGRPCKVWTSCSDFCMISLDLIYLSCFVFPTNSMVFELNSKRVYFRLICSISIYAHFSVISFCFCCSFRIFFF